MNRQQTLLLSIAELKINVLLTKSCARYLESNLWNAERSWVDAAYPQQPDVTVGYYAVHEIGNGGRELALIDYDGNIFLVHQDHASIVVG